MFEEVFISDNFFLNAFVFIYMFWYVVVGIFVPAFYYVFLRIFTFPLITRKAHELLLFVTPESVKIKKIISRETPFFYWKKGAYWFEENVEDEISMNRYNIYVEGINQNITHPKRRPNKLEDVMNYIDIPKQIGSHKIVLPTRIKDHLNRHFSLIIGPSGKVARLVPAEKRQPLRVSFYHTLGIYFQKEIKEETPREIESESHSANLQLVQLDSQVVLQEIKYVSSYKNFSSFGAWQLSKRIRNAEKLFPIWLKGAMDPRIIISITIMMIVVVSVILLFYVMPAATLGPMPTG